MDVLGLEGQHVTSIQIECTVDDLAICTVGKFITDKEAQQITQIMTDYELVKKVESEFDGSQLFGFINRDAGREEQ